MLTVFREHLYRSHAQPIFCPRCYTMFDADSDLSNHLRSDPCSISQAQPIEGIDRETLKVLRKRSPPLRLEEDKWRDTYQLLFPDVSNDDIPSPCKCISHSAATGTDRCLDYDADSPTEESRRFRRELLRRVQQELYSTAQQEGDAVEQNLLRQVAAIIQRCESQLLNDFYQGSNSTSLQPSTRTTPPSSATTDLLPPNIVFTSVSSNRTRLQHSANMIPSSSPGTIRSPIYRATQPTSGSTSYPGIPVNVGQQYVPEQMAQYPTVPWDSSEYIDWNAVFPPGPQLHGQGPEPGESALTFTMPVWT